MAQMPIQMMAGRATPFVAEAPPAATRGTPRPGSYLVDAGGISGGVLRPGAMDQAQFKALLAATQASTQAANQTPAKPALAPASPARSQAAIPTLTPAQLAALGAVAEPRTLAPSPTAEAPTAEAPAADPAAETRAARPVAPAGTDPMPRARMGADGVWELPRAPGKDEREMLHGQKWRVVEDPESARLFLGEDGKFGWDDFIDLINPLQHIPLVNIAYRAITGDEINGAARLVDFAFGPLAGVSTAVDLAFRDIAGEGIAGTAMAALFGGEDDVARTEYNTASATQIADVGRRGSHR